MKTYEIERKTIGGNEGWMSVYTSASKLKTQREIKAVRKTAVHFAYRLVEIDTTREMQRKIIQ